MFNKKLKLKFIQMSDGKLYDTERLNIKKSKKELFKKLNGKSTLTKYGNFIIFTTVDKNEEVKLLWN